MSTCAVVDGCEWIEGVCAPSGTVDIKCEMFSKPLCDKYVDSTTSIPGVTVVDAPCFFNGAGDSMDTLCVSQLWLEGGNCKVIRSNAVVLHGGAEARSCEDAHLILGWEFTCVWIQSSYGGDYGSCYTIYYLNEGCSLSSSFCFNCFFLT
jgi:hypothetical protein